LALQGPVFAPPHRAEFYEIVGTRYAAAREEAAAIANAKKIRMKVEFFKPVHFGTAWEARGYKLPVGDTTKTLLTNVALFPYGIINLTSDFDYMKWYEGNKVNYIGDWFVLPVYYYEEKQGAYKGNLEHYNFRGDETFTITVHSISYGTSTGYEVNAWLLAFVALPATLAETKITTA